MVDRSGTALCGFMIFALVTLAGCPTSSTSKPETSAPSPQAAGRGQSGSESATRERGDVPSSSSLEAMQRGETTATSASSPVKDIYFAFDSYDLRPDARETLKANADWLKAHDILVRPQRAPVADCFRMSIGTVAEMRRFMEVWARYPGTRQAAASEG